MDINEEKIKQLAEQIRRGKFKQFHDPVAWSLLHNHGIDLKKERSKSIRSAKAKARYQHSRLRTINEQRKADNKPGTLPPVTPSPNLVSSGVRREARKNYGGFLSLRQINTLKFESNNYTPPKNKKYYY